MNVRSPLPRVSLEEDVGGAILLQGRQGLIRTITTAIAAIIFSILALVVLFLAVGAEPLTALHGMVTGSVGQTSALAQTLLVTAPLILCALAAVVPFSARVFNVGADGQLLAGAVAATAINFWLHGLPPAAIVILGLVAGILGGALWGGLAGLLRAWANANEVIVTLMLNFVALELVSYAITSSWADTVAPQTRPFKAGVNLPIIWPGTVVNLGIILAAIAAAVGWLLMSRTRLGLGIRATGFNQDAARLRGFNIRSVTTSVLTIGGAFAGLGGAIMAIGTNQALVTNMDPNYGYTGIAIALVATLRPLWTLPVGFVFAAIDVGSNALPATAGVSTSASLMVLAIFVLVLLGSRVIRLTYPEVK